MGSSSDAIVSPGAEPALVRLSYYNYDVSCSGRSSKQAGRPTARAQYGARGWRRQKLLIRTEGSQERNSKTLSVAGTYWIGQLTLLQQ